MSSPRPTPNSLRTFIPVHLAASMPVSARRPNLKARRRLAKPAAVQQVTERFAALTLHVNNGQNRQAPREDNSRLSDDSHEMGLDLTACTAAPADLHRPIVHGVADNSRITVEQLWIYSIALSEIHPHPQD